MFVIRWSILEPPETGERHHGLRDVVALGLLVEVRDVHLECALRREVHEERGRALPGRAAADGRDALVGERLGEMLGGAAEAVELAQLAGVHLGVRAAATGGVQAVLGPLPRDGLNDGRRHD